MTPTSTTQTFTSTTTVPTYLCSILPGWGKGWNKVVELSGAAYASQNKTACAKACTSQQYIHDIPFIVSAYNFYGPDLCTCTRGPFNTADEAQTLCSPGAWSPGTISVVTLNNSIGTGCTEINDLVLVPITTTLSVTKTTTTTLPPG